MSAPLLVELFTEELPPKALKRLGEAFAGGIAAGLKKSGLLAQDATTVYATPRRLAVLFASVLAQGKDEPVEQKLMPLKVATGPDGKASPALVKKLGALGRPELADLFPNGSSGTDALSVRAEGKNEFVYLSTLAKGKELARALEDALEDSIAQLPIPKVMTYQHDGLNTVKFVRPVHGLVALHGSQVVNVRALGWQAGNQTHGHRFLGKADITLQQATGYEAALRDEGKVIASFEARRADIEEQLRAKAAELQCTLGDYDTLLDEVTALVEWPVVYVCSFEREFLNVPQECLILTMRTNQKYFPLFDAQGRLTERFLVVSNMAVADPVNIIEGNQRVVRPRLEDARFFFDQDRKQRLETRVPLLGKVVYHNKLGTVLERVERLQLLAGRIARDMGADPLLAERAAWLAKADLVTGMVGEFPELQGIMGRYYARHDQEPAPVADAIEAHYRPRFAGDALPDEPVAIAVALADKLDVIAGLFGIGQVPTGDKDPFALRRAALGVIRILIERNLDLSLLELVKAAVEGYKSKVSDAAGDIVAFFHDRLAGYLREQGYTTLEVDAVVSKQPVRLNVVLRQLEAVRAFLALPEAESLAAANKRVANILKQAAGKGETYGAPSTEHLKEAAERDLHAALQSANGRAGSLFEAGDYTGYLKTFAVLKAPVDAFFDQVMVMAEDAAVRRNRLALLAELRTAMNRVADISRLAS